MEPVPSAALPTSPLPSRPRRNRKPWRKLLYLSQDYPDNWVDPSFLSQLQRNINVQPYDFYALLSEFTVVVQHVASVVVFLVCFVAIYRGVLEPGVLVAGSFGGVGVAVAWGVWETEVSTPATPPIQEEENNSGPKDHSPLLSTLKSALLLYLTVLGLSPILRSLTSSISSDSIWALATWLFIFNILGFDYSSSTQTSTSTSSSSFSTNAAITASVVLASRLPDTTHVFSLVLFSIQVFGLFPVFRRGVRDAS